MKDSFYQREVTYNGKTFVCRWFAIAKYEMTYNNLSHNPDNNWRNTYSYETYTTWQWWFISKKWYPIANLNQTHAISSCRSLWTNYHLVTNNEWMTLARNLEQQSLNWSSWIKWTWGVYVGISEDNTYWCDGNPDWQRVVPSTDWTCTKRIHTISNNQTIRDLWWNLREHVDRWNNPVITTATIWNWSLCVSSNYWYNNWEPSTTCWVKYWPIYNKWWVDMWMWYVWNSWDTNRVFVRWWDAADKTQWWIYLLRLDLISTNTNGNLGFRCVR